MNQVTIFGDIHANLPALEAVQVDMAARELSNFYCLRDLVSYGTFPCCPSGMACADFDG